MSRLLGPRHPEVRRLRALLRDSRERAREQAFVLEGPRVVSAALDRGVTLEALYVSAGVDRAFPELVARAAAAGVEIAELKEGVLEKVGRTVTPQPVLAVATTPRRTVDELDPGLVLVGVGVGDPGNAGTLVRSAEATGAAGVVFTGGGVDPFNPKAVRASAGAIVGVPVVTTDEPVETLRQMAAQGRRRIGAVSSGGDPYSTAVWPSSCAIVLGNEAHGLAAEVTAALDDRVTIPLAAGESLNVAMAATVLAFAWMSEQRR